MGWLKDIRETLERIENNTERAADAAVDIVNALDEQQRDAIRKDWSDTR